MNFLSYISSLVRNQQLSHRGTSREEFNHGTNTASPAVGVTVIIPTRDAYEMLKKCVESIETFLTEVSLELIVVDNKSSDIRTLDYLEMLDSQPDTRVIRFPHPFNYSRMINLAATQASHPILLLVNNDTFIDGDSNLKMLLEHLENPRVGLVAPTLLNLDGSLQSAGLALGYKGVAGHITDLSILKHEYGHCNALAAASFAFIGVRKSVFNELRGLDDKFRVGLNDVDFCIRASKAGYRTIVCLNSRVFHVGSASRGSPFQINRAFRVILEVSRFLALYPHLKDDYFALSRIPSRIRSRGGIGIS